VQLFGLEGHQGAAHFLHLMQPFASLFAAVVTYTLPLSGHVRTCVQALMLSSKHYLSFCQQHSPWHAYAALRLTARELPLLN